MGTVITIPEEENVEDSVTFTAELTPNNSKSDQVGFAKQITAFFPLIGNKKIVEPIYKKVALPSELGNPNSVCPDCGKDFVNAGGFLWMACF